MTARPLPEGIPTGNIWLSVTDPADALDKFRHLSESLRTDPTPDVPHEVDQV